MSIDHTKDHLPHEPNPISAQLAENSDLHSYTSLAHQLHANVLSFLQQKNIDLHALFALALSDTYKYPIPYEKAKAITEISIIGANRETPEIDKKNISLGIGGECSSNTHHLYHQCQPYLKSTPHINVKIAHGNDNGFFVGEDSTHVFLIVEVDGQTIIVDPSLKLIAFLDESGYTIKGYLEATDPIRDDQTKLVSPIGNLTFHPNGYFQFDEKLLPLGMMGAGTIFVSYSIALYNNHTHVPIIQIQDILGNTYYSFLDDTGKNRHQGTYDFLPGLEQDITDILHHLDRVIVHPSKKE